MYSFGLTCLSYNKQKSQGSSSLPRALQVGGVTIDKEIGKGGIQYSFFFFTSNPTRKSRNFQGEDDKIFTELEIILESFFVF